MAQFFVTVLTNVKQLLRALSKLLLFFYATFEKTNSTKTNLHCNDVMNAQMRKHVQVIFHPLKK